MKKKTPSSVLQEGILVDLTLHGVPSSILTEFAKKIAQPYYQGNLNAAIQDLMQKTLVEQDLVLSHITHVRDSIAKTAGRFFG